MKSLKQERETIKPALIQNGYSNRIIKRCLKELAVQKQIRKKWEKRKSTALKERSKHSKQLEPSYQIRKIKYMRYHTDCELVYIGQTDRKTKARIDHRNKNKQTTLTVVIHILQDSYKMGFENTKLIKIDNVNKRLVRETIEIEKTGNIRNDCINLSEF